MNALLPHQIENRNPKRLVIHYSSDAAPVVEVYRKKYLSEYIAAGFRECLNRAGDEVHCIHPYAPYSARA